MTNGKSNNRQKRAKIARESLECLRNPTATGVYLETGAPAWLRDLWFLLHQPVCHDNYVALAIEEALNRLAGNSISRNRDLDGEPILLMKWAMSSLKRIASSERLSTEHGMLKSIEIARAKECSEIYNRVVKTIDDLEE